MLDFLNTHKYTFFLLTIGTVIVAIIVFIIWILYSRQDKQSIILEPTIPPEIEKSFQSQIKKTPEDKIKTLPDLKGSHQTDQGTEYSFPSINLSSDDTIITKEGYVIFEKNVTTDTNYDHPELSYYLTLLGEPERIMKGSKTYGTTVNYYIFASKGITLIGRPFSNEVEEIQQYVPMSIEEYIAKWGDDILYNTGLESKENL